MDGLPRNSEAASKLILKPGAKGVGKPDKEFEDAFIALKIKRPQFYV